MTAIAANVTAGWASCYSWQNTVNQNWWNGLEINKINICLRDVSELSQDHLQSRLRTVSEFTQGCLRVVIEWPQSLLTVVSESSKSFLRAFSVPSQKMLQSHLRVVSELLPLSWIKIQQNKLKLNFSYFDIFWYFKLLQTIEWNMKERKWRIFCTFKKKYYESFQFWFTVWLVCDSIPTHPSPFWLWIAAMIKSWLQTIYSSTTYWEIGFWMHNGIFCISL